MVYSYIGSLPFLKFWLRLKCKKFAFRLLQELKKTSYPIYSYSFQRKIYTSILIAKKNHWHTNGFFCTQIIRNITN